MPAVLGRLAVVFDRMQEKHRVMVEALRGGWTPDAADALLGAIDEDARRLGTCFVTRRGVSWRGSRCPSGWPPKRLRTAFAR